MRAILVSVPTSCDMSTLAPRIFSHIFIHLIYMILNPYNQQNRMVYYIISLRIRKVCSGPNLSANESVDTTECMNGEQRPRWYFAHAQMI